MLGYRLVGDNLARNFFEVDTDSGRVTLSRSLNQDSALQYSVKSHSFLCLQSILYCTVTSCLGRYRSRSKRLMATHLRAQPVPSSLSLLIAIFTNQHSPNPTWRRNSSMTSLFLRHTISMTSSTALRQRTRTTE